MRDKLYEFSELEEFLKSYTPMSPYGKIEKNERHYYTEANHLKGVFDSIETMVSFIKSHPRKSDEIEYHLSRIPQLSKLLNEENIRSELFNIKKFLHNYRKIFFILQSEKKKTFLFDFQSDILLTLLGYGENQEETFYLEDSYSDELREIRRRIRSIDLKLSDLKEKRFEQIKDVLGLDFRFHDFLVIKEMEMSEKSNSFIYREPYDNHSILVKPLFEQNYYYIHNSRKEILQCESKIESEILISLKKNIEEEQEKIKQYIDNITFLDTILAKARLAIKYRCTRPFLYKNHNIKIELLNFIPLKKKCEENGRQYSPLSVEFDKRNIVVTGSNMGGKTVLLKSIAFCQLLVQRGFFVPAKSVETTLFSSLNLIGYNIGKSTNGLSSFGEEIRDLIETDRSGKTLLFLDEFARTTNSTEAHALNSAILEYFSDKTDFYSFSSTHLDNLPLLKNVSYWTMRGLDYKKYTVYYHKNYCDDLIGRINLINEFMDYGVEPQQGSDSRKDALKIADILGLDSEIVKNAEKYIEKQEKNNG